MILLRRCSASSVGSFAKTWIKSNQKRGFIPNIHGRVGVIGVPFGKGQKETGLKEEGLTKAPDILRDTGFMDDLTRIGIDVADYGNVCYEDPGTEICHQNMINLNHVAACNKQVFTQVTKVLSEGRTCLTLGGDHSIATGTISGHMSFTGPDDIAVIYVDAHADINTNLTSESGSIHGMPMALLTEELSNQWESPVPGFEWLSPTLSAKNFAFIGLRSVDPPEFDFITRHKICAFSMEEVQKLGIRNVIRRALNRVDPQQKKSIHLSFDIDSLDYFEAPCTTVPVRGGLTLREALEIVETVYRTKRLGAVDLVEVNPLLGNEYQVKITLDAAKHILLGMLGHSRRGNPCSCSERRQ